MAIPTVRDTKARIPGAGYVSCSTLVVEESGGPINDLFWRHIEHGLKPEQDHPKKNQGKPVNLTQLHENQGESLLDGSRKHFLHRRFQDVAVLPLKKCARSITIPIINNT
jgi:hypothetical protein